MLSLLHIEQVAIIDQAELQPENGLCVLTGETGAGKSIIIDAIRLVLGAKASREQIRAEADHAYVSALFTDIGESAKDLLASCGFAAADEILLEREVTAAGRSIAKLNGRPVTLLQLRQMAELLINIHGQQDTHQLADPAGHLALLDRFSPPGLLLTDYQTDYFALHGLREQISSLEQADSQKERRAEFLAFQIKELTRAKLQAGEEAQLLERRKLLRAREQIAAALSGSIAALTGDETEPSGARSQVDQAAALMQQVARFGNDLAACADALSNASFVLEDCCERLYDLRSGMEEGGGDLNTVESRLDAIATLKRKYNCADEGDLLAELTRMEEELAGMEHSDQILIQLHKQEKETIASLLRRAQALRTHRKQSAQELCERVLAELADLDMPRVRFVARFTQLAEPGEQGPDEMEFDLSANPGESLKPLSRIASGGELSRIMLALLCVMGKSAGIDSMIFDEIDSGVSGRAADKIARKLRTLAKDKQVICVSHLVQIAAAARQHVLIEKEQTDIHTTTQVTTISGQRRVEEIARLGGASVLSATALEHARELLKQYDT